MSQDGCEGQFKVIHLKCLTWVMTRKCSIDNTCDSLVDIKFTTQNQKAIPLLMIKASQIFQNNLKRDWLKGLNN